MKTAAQASVEGTAGLQGKLPAAAARKPVALGPDGPQLGLGDGIEWGDHLDRAGGTQPHQAPGRLSQGLTARRLEPQGRPGNPIGPWGAGSNRGPQGFASRPAASLPNEIKS